MFCLLHGGNRWVAKARWRFVTGTIWNIGCKVLGDTRSSVGGAQWSLEFNFGKLTGGD